MIGLVSQLQNWAVWSLEDDRFGLPVMMRPLPGGGGADY